MKIRYNAPVTLSFALICAAVLVFDQLTGGNLTATIFSVPGRGGFQATNLLHWLRLFTHAAGHAGWSHLMGNMAYILLLGPILEEKYGGGNLIFMIIMTALVTGVANILFISNGLYGASGIVFMMILLVSFTNIKSGEIPLTFILIVTLYLAQQIIQSFQANDISEFAHIVGGICGSIFGFLRPRKT